jgi:hypothetical protein
MAALATSIWSERAIAMLAKRWVYGHKLRCAGRAEDGTASFTSTTLWRKNEIQKVL